MVESDAIAKCPPQLQDWAQGCVLQAAQGGEGVYPVEYRDIQSWREQTMAARQQATNRLLYGIGEWYGRSFSSLTGEERQHLASIQRLPKRDRPEQVCLPRSLTGATVACSKEGGVCSLRLYGKDGQTGEVSPDTRDDVLATTCPYRFYEGNRVFEWIGKTILDTPNPVTVGEVGFLEREGPRSELEGETVDRDDVGRIDHVLVHPSTERLCWCALEMQAVYFSGDSMQKDFRAIEQAPDDGIPFPAGRRHPDFRSSGPKRLMPQLQIKVPTLRRWGKKMCVLVDQSFFHALGQMDEIPHLSNCDVAWFVVRYEEREDGISLVPDRVHYTTLERAVEGLTAGNPVSLPEFEKRICAKLNRVLRG